MRTGIFHEKRLVAHAAIQHLAKHKPMLRWGPKTYLDILPAYKSRWIPRRLVDLAAARHVLLALLLHLYHHSIDLSVSTVVRVLLGHFLSMYESTDMLKDTPAFVSKCKGRGTGYIALGRVRVSNLDVEEAESVQSHLLVLHNLVDEARRPPSVGPKAEGHRLSEVVQLKSACAARIHDRCVVDNLLVCESVGEWVGGWVHVSVSVCARA